jgi:hypothetical protein
MTRIASGSPVSIHSRRTHLLGLLPLCPRPNAAFESHLAAVRLDGDVFGVDFRIAAKGFLDLALDFGRGDARFHYDQIGDALDASDASNRVLGPRALIIPFSRALERDPPVPDHDLHVFGGER